MSIAPRLRRALLGLAAVAAVGTAGTVACERHVHATRHRRMVTAAECVLDGPAATPEARQALVEAAEASRERGLGPHVYRTLHNRCKAILADGRVTRAEVEYLAEALRDAVELPATDFAYRYHGAR